MRDSDLLDEGAELLAKSPESDMLREADLSGNMFGPPAAQALGETEHLGNLLVLNVSDNPLGQPAAKALIDSPLGKRLLQIEQTNTFGQSDDIPF
jgi:Ran GTPase-activating protein (RanGAP) involved in mRNA processing and transport